MSSGPEFRRKTEGRKNFRKIKNASDLLPTFCLPVNPPRNSRHATNIGVQLVSRGRKSTSAVVGAALSWLPRGSLVCVFVRGKRFRVRSLVRGAVLPCGVVRTHPVEPHG